MARLLDTKIRWKDRFGKYHCAKAYLKPNLDKFGNVEDYSIIGDPEKISLNPIQEARLREMCVGIEMLLGQHMINKDVIDCDISNFLTEEQVMALLKEAGWSIFPIREVNLGFGTDESSAPAEADHLYPGDTVKLQSGGPLMTVLEVTKKGVRCGWFLGKDNQEGTFPAVALYKESPSWRGKKAEE